MTRSPFAFPRVRTLRTAAALALLAVGAAACGDDDGFEEDEPEIARIRLTVTPASGTPVNYTLQASETANAVVAFRAGTNTLSAVALDANNQTIDLGSEFELQMVQSVSIPQGSASELVTPLPAGVTFTPNGSMSGAALAITGPSATERPAVLRMFHKGEGHTDFDAKVRYTVAP